MINAHVNVQVYQSESEPEERKGLLQESGVFMSPSLLATASSSILLLHSMWGVRLTEARVMKYIILKTLKNTRCNFWQNLQKLIFPRGSWFFYRRFFPRSRLSIFLAMPPLLHIVSWACVVVEKGLETVFLVTKDNSVYHHTSSYLKVSNLYLY